MIKDIFIVKDGLPILSEHNKKDTQALNNDDNLILISGFLSAIDSFSTQFKGFGNISELKLSNDLKLSFLRDNRINDLVYVATSDTKTDDHKVRKVLRKISSSFSNRYNTQMLEKWQGRSSYFKEVKEELSKIVSEEEQPKKTVMTNENKISEVKPILKIDLNSNPERFITGEKALNIVKYINGKNTIAIIAGELNYEQSDVFNICKNLMKMSLISFCM